MGGLASAVVGVGQVEMRRRLDAGDSTEAIVGDGVVYAVGTGDLGEASGVVIGEGDAVSGEGVADRGEAGVGRIVGVFNGEGIVGITGVGEAHGGVVGGG